MEHVQYVYVHRHKKPEHKKERKRVKKHKVKQEHRVHYEYVWKVINGKRQKVRRRPRTTRKVEYEYVVIHGKRVRRQRRGHVVKGTKVAKDVPAAAATKSKKVKRQKAKAKTVRRRKAKSKRRAKEKAPPGRYPSWWWGCRGGG